MIHRFTPIFLLLSLTAFAPVANATRVTLPKPTGHLAVGTKSVVLLDPQRKMLRGGDQRRWIIQAFYPTESFGTQVFPYMPGTLEDGKVKGVQVLTHSKPDAMPLNQGPFPVIFFVHGLGNVRQSYTILCEELASHGYIVLSLDQPYESNFVRFPDGSTVVLTFYDAWKMSNDRDYRYQYYDEAMDGTMGDIRFMLDHLKEIDHEFFSDLLDSSSISIMGHSFGGNVANTLGFEDPRIRSVVDIDSKITERKVHGRLGPPANIQGKAVLFIRGAMQYQEDVGDLLKRVKNGRVINFNVQHSAFHDSAFLSRKIDGLENIGSIELVWKWLFKLGPPFGAIDISLGGKDVEAWFHELRREIVDWLSIHFPRKQKFAQ